MTKFSYKAKEGPGRLVTGTIEAETVDTAIQKVIKMGLAPIDISEAALEKNVVKENRIKPSFKILQKVRLAEIVLFTRQMSDLADASVPILRSLQVVFNQTQNPYFRGVIEEMSLSVKDGSTLSDALAQHSNIFSNLFVNMVRAGEVSGELEVVLNRLADYLEREEEIRGKVKGSLAYPALILGVGVLTIIVILTFVIPRLSVMFEDLSQDLPVVTRVLMGMSDFLANFWWVILAVIFGISLYFKQWLSTPKGQLTFDSLKLKVPFFSNFIKMVEIARFTRTLGTLVESGVNITTALKSVWMLIDNQVLRNDIKNVSEEVTNGASLKKALQHCSFFPEMAVNMISVGEETGRLDRSLYKVAESYERQSDQVVKTIISLLGPLVLVVVVAIVGSIVISLLLPIFKMNLLIE